MIGVAPATHALVLYGLLAVGAIIVVAMIHNHWLHSKLRK